MMIIHCIVRKKRTNLTFKIYDKKHLAFEIYDKKHPAFETLKKIQYF